MSLKGFHYGFQIIVKIVTAYPKVWEIVIMSGLFWRIYRSPSTREEEKMEFCQSPSESIASSIFQESPSRLHKVVYSEAGGWCWLFQRCVRYSDATLKYWSSTFYWTSCSLVRVMLIRLGLWKIWLPQNVKGDIFFPSTFLTKVTWLFLPWYYTSVPCDRSRT